jgi:hypothetical protein
MPRSSDSLSTVTPSPSIATSRVAARKAISVATQLAAAARSNQPGDGALPVPPTEDHVRGDRLVPLPVTTTNRPARSVAAAALSRYRASSAHRSSCPRARSAATRMVGPFSGTVDPMGLIAGRRDLAGAIQERITVTSAELVNLKLA